MKNSQQRVDAYSSRTPRLSNRIATQAAYIGAPLRKHHGTPQTASDDVAGAPRPGDAAYIGNRQNILRHWATRRTSPGRVFIGRPPPGTRPSRHDLEAEEHGLKAGVIGLPLPQHRVHLENEVAESADLRIPGENRVGGSDTGIMPVRVLTDFTIFQEPSGKIVPFESLLGQDPECLAARNYRAVGHAAVWFEDDSESESESENNSTAFGHHGQIAVFLSAILDVSIHHVEDYRPRHFSLDPKLYIRTAHAWYILYVPSPDYHAFFAPFWIKARLFHEVVSSLHEDRRMSYEDFLDALPDSDASEAAEDVLGYCLTQADIQSDDTVAYIIANLNDLIQQEDLHFLFTLQHGKLVTTLQNSVQPKPTVLDPTAKLVTQAESTVVTPWIYQIATRVFSEKQLECCGPLSTLQVPSNFLHHPCHEGAIRHVLWVKESWLGVPGHYSAAILDGVRYDAGDCVMLEKGADDNQRRQENAAAKHSKSTNPLANTKWFAKICYFFEEEGEIMVHAQWFQHGAQIILQELAHPQGLFLIDECEDQPISSIYQKANVQALQSNEEEPINTPSYSNNFFTGVMWDRNNCVFTEHSPTQVQDAFNACKAGHPCLCCGIRSIRQTDDLWSTSDFKSLTHCNISFHLHDFVYIRPDTTTHVYIIGQIVKLNLSGQEPFTVDLRIYDQMDELIRVQHMDSFDARPTDEHRLLRTDKVLEQIDVHRIEGKAFVLHVSMLRKQYLEHWLDQDNHFYYDSPAISLYCKQCFRSDLQSLRKQQQCLESHTKLRGLELFAGAGGLSAGLEQAKFVETLWAVEWSPSAAQTYQANHPHATVYNQSVNACLKHAIQTSRGENPGALYSRGKISHKLPCMPKPGDVDIIYGGPPCQGFSKMNHTKKPNDLRNTLVANMISYVDFYRPKFFLLENVLGMFDWRGHTALADDDYDGEIMMAAVKFITRAMIGLGYQIHFRPLDAGHYGAPQSRRRVIFLGARRGIPLPLFPIPTHAAPKNVQKKKLPTGDILYPVVRYRSVDADLNEQQTHLQFAPYLFVTVEDAISDLPKFDWCNPHDIIPETKKDIRKCAHRTQSGIPCHIAVTNGETDYCGFSEGVPYPFPPQNKYQEWMRSGNQQGLLLYHYTAKYGSKLVERTVNIPLEANANHDSLPMGLRLSNKMLNADGTSKQAYTSLFQRIDGKGLFRTALTSVSPNNKGGTVLHPSQKRVITVRECARAQGFPDHWKFLSERKSPKLVVQDQFMQIGNAVPVPLAFALGKEICKAVIKMWEEDDAREEREREESPEIDQY